MEQRLNCDTTLDDRDGRLPAHQLFREFVRLGGIPYGPAILNADLAPFRPTPALKAPLDRLHAHLLHSRAPSSALPAAALSGFCARGERQIMRRPEYDEIGPPHVLPRTHLSYTKA
jgi:hypothetical protein